MTKILPAIERRNKKRSYQNFNVALYCPVESISHITDFAEYEKKFAKITDHIKIGRVYLEDFRAMASISKDQLLKVKDFFEKKGIATSGGITTCASHNDGDGFLSLCYSDEKACEILKKSVIMNAEIFDEFIFDDFYFLNCRCKKCIEKKGNRSWQEFRIEQKKWVTSELVMKPAKQVNPDVNVIVKFPQWFEDFNETGYDLSIDTASFDSIYTGTETRNPDYAMQHLPRYLSYFTQRFYGSDAPGKNLGGWYDPYDCTYNLTRYMEQGYLTAFAKAPEITLFCSGSLMDDPTYRTFVPAMGEAFLELDEYLGRLGNPEGVMAYHPSYGRGENNIHSYLGMCGIPMEPCLIYPKDASSVFLAESAADDKEIIAKMKETLLSGGNVIVTSGFVRKLGALFDEFAHLVVSGRKAIVSDYGISTNHGVNFGGKYSGDAKVIIPQIDFCTNDTWEIAGAYATGNNFPIVLRWQYGPGNISVITIPDNYGDLYHYPSEVLSIIRDQFAGTTSVSIDAPSGVMLFSYDNNTFVIDSSLPYNERIRVKLPAGTKEAVNLANGRKFPVASDGTFELYIEPSAYNVFCF